VVRLERTADHLSELIDGLSFGASRWEDIVGAFGAAIPGSFALVHNTSFSYDSSSSMVAHNVADGFIESYVEHYAPLNPWAGYWTRARSGTVAASEAVAPSALYKKTEFYNDWLMPQNRLEAGAAIKISADIGQTIMLAHYPLKFAEHYDVVAVRLLKHVRGNINRAVEFARAARTREEMGAGAAALVARGTAAFVVAEGGRLVTANEAAERLFRSGVPLTATNGRITIGHPAADLTFKRTISDLCHGLPTNTACIPVATGTGRWRLSIAAVNPGTAASRFDSILPARRLVFVSVSEMTPNLTGLDTNTLQSLFGLSRAEQALCVRLMAGDTLDDAADHLGVKKETVRTQLRVIFAKTGTSRQSELMLLLAKLC
jgi:DNA-binding CsgD family transcriptional regulator